MAKKPSDETTSWTPDDFLTHRDTRLAAPPDETTSWTPGALPKRREPLTLVLSHRDGTSVVDLRSGGSIVIGRAAPSDFVVPDDTLSRQHARVTVDDGEVFIVDLASTNGTFVNGERAVELMRVRTTDEVLLGGVVAVLTQGAVSTFGARGFLPHDTFSFLMQEEAERARAFRRPFALVLVEVESGGHVARLASHVGRSVRPVDRLAVFSDDTLEIFMPECEAAEAAATAERILDRAQGEGFKAHAVVAPHPQTATTADGLMRRARAALVDARRSERPVVLGATEGEPASAASEIVLGEKMRRVFDDVARYAESRSPVLVLGESGTGKEIVARAIHTKSKRKGEFKALNCGAVPEHLIESELFGHVPGAFTTADKARAGIFESAKGGTVFLDEIGEMPLAAQVKLLRVLQEKCVKRVGSNDEIAVDFRVVAATNQDLEAMVREGRFRLDLLSRLKVLDVQLPPLRERKEDIPRLAKSFLAMLARDQGRAPLPVDDDAMAALLAYEWPGNVRELQAKLEHASVNARGDAIMLGDLHSDIRRLVVKERADSAARSGIAVRSASDDVEPLPDLNFRDAVRAYERRMILDALSRAGEVQTKAAHLLELPLRTFVHKMRTLGIKRNLGGYRVEED